MDSGSDFLNISVLLGFEFVREVREPGTVRDRPAW